jgi:hypothetical protein
MEAREGHGGGCTVVAHAEDVEEEQVPTGVWQGNGRVRV